MTVQPQMLLENNLHRRGHESSEVPTFQTNATIDACTEDDVSERAFPAWIDLMLRGLAACLV